MKAISLWQPWASMMGRGKCIETRHWPAPEWLIGQRVAIHAAKRPLTGSERWLLAELGCYGRFIDADALPFGAIVSVATLRACEVITRGMPLNPVERLLGNYAPGRYGWHFSNFQHLQVPIPTVGRQGIFNVEEIEL